MITLKSAFGLGMASMVSFQCRCPETRELIYQQLRTSFSYSWTIWVMEISEEQERINTILQILNRLANQGMQFTWYYCPQAVSSASRAGLLTGCYPNRIGISGALMPWSQIGLSSEETTIAEVLRTKGYHTGIIGKWHLGHQKQFLPLQHGFDYYYGIPYSNDMWPVDFDGVPIRLKDTTSNKMKYPVLPLIEGNEKVGEVPDLAGQDKLTTEYTERAVKFIVDHKKEAFFLYLPHSMVHVPLGVSEKFRGKSKQGMFGDVMMEVDWSVGEIMKALKSNGLEK